MLKQFLKYVSLNTASMIGLSVYILADTFFISLGMGSRGLTALNLALPVYNLIYGIGMMAGIGGAVRFAYYKIHKDVEQADRMFMSSVWLGMFLGVVIMIAGQIIAGPLAKMLGADEAVFDMTRNYLRVIMTFAPAFILNNTLSSYVRNDNGPGLAMTGMLLGSLFNVLFDYIFIFPLGLGMKGAALATGFSPVMGLLTLSFHFIRKKNSFHFRMMRPTLRNFGSIFRLGFGAFIDQTAQGVLMLAFNLMILRLVGNVGVAAYGVILNVYLVIVSIFNGIAQGAQPLMTELYAKNSRRRLGAVLRYGVITVAIVSALIYLFSYGWTDGIVAAFNSEGNAEMAVMAANGLRLNFAGVLLAGWNVLLAMYFISINRGLPAQLISICRGILLILPLAILMSALWGLNGIWLSMPVTEVIVFAVAVWYAVVVSKKNKKSA